MKVRFHLESAVLWAVCFALQGAVWAQQAEKTPPAGATVAPAQKPGPSKKAVLTDATRASTSKAMESAAKQKVAAAGEQEPRAPEDSAVTEFRAVPPGQESTEQRATATSSGQKARSGPLKDVHGSVHGAADSGARTTGAAAGASSKSGKTSVYIEGQRARESSPRP